METIINWSIIVIFTFGFGTLVWHIYKPEASLLEKLALPLLLLSSIIVTEIVKNIV